MTMHVQLLNPSLRYLIVIVLLLLVTLTIVTHYYLNQFDQHTAINHNHQFNGIGQNGDAHHDTQSIIKQFNLMDNHNDDRNCESMCMKETQMKQRLKHLLSIRSSVTQELRQMESKRQKLMEEMSMINNKLDDLKGLLMKKNTELERIHQSLEQAKVSHREEEALMMKTGHLISPPLQLQLLPSAAQTNDDVKGNYNNDFNSQHCIMHHCFDYSRCSLASPFFVYFYHPDSYGLNDDHSKQSQILDSLNTNHHVTFDPSIACIYLVILNHHNEKPLTKSQFDSYLNSLTYWAGDGRNHLIINLIDNLDLHAMGVNVGKAMVAQTQFYRHSFRLGFDIVSPQMTLESVTSFVPSPHSPARRKYLLSFQSVNSIDNGDVNEHIKTALLKMSNGVSSNQFKLEFNCVKLCTNRSSMLEQSTFTLLLPPNEPDSGEIISYSQLSLQLREILFYGAIPVFIGSDQIRFPLSEVIDWSRAVIHCPLARVTELHFILQSISDADILDMRRYGQLYLERHLLNSDMIVESVLSLIRQKRLHIPAPAHVEAPSQTLYNTSSPMVLLDATSSLINADTALTEDEVLGPIEPPFPSLSYQRNYSLVMMHSYELWNDHRWSPFTNYHATPFDPLLPSEAKFLGSSYGYRPIGGGSGGAGKEFSDALGGNVPKEQFTIVILTYEREAVLLDSLSRLKGIPHLNKVLVVWNSPSRDPSSDLRWPDIGVQIEAVKSRRNSLNNRFLPYPQIETDAVLSMDDDAHLRHDEIVFGFRVWREARDRIVGFPGRYHAWDPKGRVWQYNSNYSCELSMVLTGAAFYHKYTYVMPQLIRDKIDEFMNCEDIAMNFLVSHISRQPPIKVTSRWTFRCPGCPVSLSEDDSHFQERHRCINYFVSIYGYMPLLNTQFRADSVLFKTRIPHDKQKCFKFI